eukprot:5839610-Prymnesium_polylepis.1
MGGPGLEVKHRGIVVPYEDALQHARHNLRAHSEVRELQTSASKTVEAKVLHAGRMGLLTSAFAIAVR